MIDLLKDENGKWSSSRLVLVFFCLLFAASVFGPWEFSPTAETTIHQVIMLCLGTVGVRSAIKNSK